MRICGGGEVLVNDEPWREDEPIVAYFHEYRRPFDVWVARVSKALAFGVVLAAHVALVMAWRPSRLATSEAAIGEAGAGGIMVSLVSGRLGLPAAETIAPPEGGAGAPGALAGESADGATGEGATAHPNAGASGPAATRPAASKGGLANDDGVTSAASVGVGYDPWAQASLAPRLLKVRSEPGLWEQVTRCWRGERPRSDLAVTVVLSEGGAFVGAYPQAASSLVTSTTGDGDTFARLVAALTACAPYHDVPTGLASRVTLVVPAAGS